MTEFANALNDLSNIAGTFGQINQATQAIGGIFGGSGLGNLIGGPSRAVKNASRDLIATANFNNQLDDFNTQRRIEHETNQASRMISTNRAIEGGSGFSVTSASFLTNANEILSTAQRTINNEVIDLKNRKGIRLFEAEQKAKALKIQGGSIFDDFQSAVGAIRGISSAVSTIGELL